MALIIIIMWKLQITLSCYDVERVILCYPTMRYYEIKEVKFSRDVYYFTNYV